MQETHGASAGSQILPMLGLSRKWAEAMMRRVYGSDVEDLGQGPEGERSGGSRSNSELWSNSNNGEKRLEKENSF